MTNEQTAVKATYFSIIGNALLAIIKGLAGFFGNSYALTADAIESTTDIFSSFWSCLESSILIDLPTKTIPTATAEPSH